MPKSQFSSLAMSLSIDHQAQWCQGAWTWTCAPTLTTWNIGMVGDLQAGHEKLNPQGYEEPIYWSLRFFQVDFWPSYWPCFHWDWDQHGNFTIQLQYDNWQNCSIRWRIPYTVSLFSCWWNHCIFMYIWASFANTFEHLNFLSSLRTWWRWLHLQLRKHHESQLHRQNTFFFC